MHRICVVGLGYIGLPTAAMFATTGASVVGVDVDPDILFTLNSGSIHIEEPGLATLVRAATHSGNLLVSEEPVESDVFIIAVPTPLTESQDADLSYVKAAVESIVPVLRQGNLVILESTSPPGTTLQLIPILEQSGINVGSDVMLAYSPERVLPGRILLELVENERVIGGVTQEASEAAAELYRTFVTGDILVTDSTTAEMVKLMENTYRDVNIALANELSRVAEGVGIDVHEAIRLANHHPRVQFLQPGPGVGGHCIAVDPWFIASRMPDSTELLRTARKINVSQPIHVADRVDELLRGFTDPTIAVLGLTYKADIDDLRGSPALSVVDALHLRGYRTRLHDPYCKSNRWSLCLIPSVDEAIDGADMILVLTDHTEYKNINPGQLQTDRMRSLILYDTRACLDVDLWQKHGFHVHRLGVSIEKHESRVTS